MKNGQVGQSRSLGRVFRLTRKELRETLRDRRTVITLVLMPLLVYPLLSISFQKSLLVTAQQNPTTVYRVAVQTRRDMEILNALLQRGGQTLAQRTKEDASAPPSTSEDAPSPWPIPEESIRIHWGSDGTLEELVTNLDMDVAVRIQMGESARPGRRRVRPVQCELIYQGRSTASQRAMRFIDDRLRAVNDQSLQDRLRQIGAPAGVPAQIVHRPLIASTKAPFSLATLVPLVLILMTITGSVYPAIDLTAGERERGTLETLIAAPVSRMTLLVAKYTAVLTVAILTAVMNLVAMTVTILSSSLSKILFPGGVSVTLIVEIFGLMVLFAAFFSAIVLAITSFARSFKEAQAYLIPVMLLAISPGLLSLMPGLQLNGLLAVTPLVNIVLLSRDLLEGVAAPSMIALAITSTVCYALAAIAAASKIFGNDALLYASRGSWSDLFRRPDEPRAAPSTAMALTCLAIAFPCYFVLGNLVALHTQSVPNMLLLNGAVLAIVFGLCPFLFLLVQRIRLLSGFQFRPASWLSFVGALVLGVSLWPFAFQLFRLGEELGLVTIDRSHFAVVEALMKDPISPALVLFTLALIPAVLEELFFRGFLLNGLRDRYRGIGVVITSALLFALFHVFTPSMLTPERFLPSALVGLVLGWVCYRTASVVPGMLLHLTHNGLLLLIVLKKDWFISMGWDQERANLPMLWLLLAAVGVAIGASLVFVGTRAKKRLGRR